MKCATKKVGKICFNDFSEGCTSRKGTIPVMKDVKPNKKEIKIQLQVLIKCIEDCDLKEQCKRCYS